MSMHFSSPGKEDSFEGEGMKRYVNYLLSAFPKQHSRQEEFLEQMLKPSQYRRFSRELAEDCLTRELNSHLDAPSPITSFFFWNRTRREISQVPFGIMKDIPYVFCPFLDHEVFDVLASLPTSLFVDLKFRNDAIARGFPKAAAIPYDGTIRASKVYAESYFRQFGRDLLWWLVVRSPGPLLRRSTAVSMALKSAINWKWGRQLFAKRWAGPHTVYLAQLESFLRQLPVRNEKVNLHLAARAEFMESGVAWSEPK